MVLGNPTIPQIGHTLVVGEGWYWRMGDTVPVEIMAILHEIDKALDAKLYYVAIAVALSVPDICASLEFDPDNPRRANETSYSTWWDTYGGAQFTNLAGIDLYRLRCGVLHFGHFGHAKAKFNRVMFIGPQTGFNGHDLVLTVAEQVAFGGVSAEELRLSGRVLLLDVVRFCRSIMDTASAWSIAKAKDPYVAKNLLNLVRYRPDGLPPFSVGVPTIA